MNIDLKEKTDSAVAIVNFTGMGLVCAGEGEEAVLETLFIHAKEHSLKIFIRNEDGGELMKSFTEQDFISSDSDGLHSQVKIRISGVVGKTSKNRGIQKYRTDGFARLNNDSDKNDFGWLINLRQDGLLGDVDAQPKYNPNYARSVLRIENALVYTEKFVEDEKNSEPIPFFKVNEPDYIENISEASLNTQEYGNVADTLGAAIFGKAVEIEICYGSKSFTYWLNRAEKPYFIEVSNMGAEPESDMDIYREFWKTKSKKKFNLISRAEEKMILQQSEGGGAVGTRRTCALADGGAENIDGFTVKTSNLEEI